MFRGLQSFVSDLEATARSQAQWNPDQQQQQQPERPSSRSQSPSVASPQAGIRSPPLSGSGSNAQLAENAISGLRKSFRSGPRSSVDQGSRPQSPAVATAASSPSKELAPLSFPEPANKPSAPHVPEEKEEEQEEVEPEPAPLPPEPEAVSQHLAEITEKAAGVQLPGDPIPQPVAAHKEEKQPIASSSQTPLTSEYQSLFAQYTPFQDGLPSLQDLGGWLASQADQSAKLNTLQAKANTHQSRLQEMRDTHKLEVQSLNNEIAGLHENHAAELAKANDATQEAEEGRKKGLAFLRGLRSKLSQAEQAKDEADKAKQRATAEAEASVHRLRSGFEREIVQLRGLHEKESAGKKSQAETELINVKASYQQEISSRDKRVKQLETRVAQLQGEKDELFSNSQHVESELESARTWASDLETQLNDRHVQLQEALDQVESLQQQASDVRSVSQDEASASDAAAVSAEQAREHQEAMEQMSSTYKSKISALESKIASLEASRSRAEAEMSATMEGRLHEVERMRLDTRKAQGALEASDSVVREWRDRAQEFERRLKEEQGRVGNLEQVLEDGRLESTRFTDRIDAVREDLKEASQRIAELELRLDESHSKEAQARTNIKLLRDELRKVQSGVLVSENARNPGVGYFSSLKTSQQTSTPGTASPALGSSAMSPPLQPVDSADSLASRPQNAPSLASSQGAAPSAAETKDQQAEAVNFEYIRNVILQFLEHKEMRPHLVNVLGVILHFTPQELRRVSAKATA